MVAASIAGFLVAQAFLSGYRPTYSLSEPDVLASWSGPACT